MKTICKVCLLAAGILFLGHSAMAQETEINDMTTAPTGIQSTLR